MSAEAFLALVLGGDGAEAAYGEGQGAVRLEEATRGLASMADRHVGGKDSAGGVEDRGGAPH